jgi:hypothetical protein
MQRTIRSEENGHVLAAQVYVPGGYAQGYQAFHKNPPVKTISGGPLLINILGYTGRIFKYLYRKSH